jgi:hypothetical protein
MTLSQMAQKSGVSRSELLELPRNLHAVKVVYVGATENKPSRLRLTSQRFERDSITFSYDSEYNSAFEQAVVWLRSNGFTVVSLAEMPNAIGLVMVSDFEALKEAAKHPTGAKGLTEDRKNKS